MLLSRRDVDGLEEVVKDLVHVFDILSVGEPVMVGKSAVALAKRVFASSGEVMVSWDEGREARGLEVFYDDK